MDRKMWSVIKNYENKLRIFEPKILRNIFPGIQDLVTLYNTEIVYCTRNQILSPESEGEC